jgi:hypothetical protein
VARFNDFSLNWHSLEPSSVRWSETLLCRLIDIGCGSTTPVIEFAVIGAGVALIITFLMRG